MTTAYWLAHSGIVVAGRTPGPLRHALASTVTTASYLGWRSKRLVTQENMAQVLGVPAGHPRARRAARVSWSTYGRTAAALACLPYVDLADVAARTEDRSVGSTWQQRLHEALDAGYGAVVTTGHFGSWDLAGAMAARHVPLSAVADTFKDARLNALLQGHRRDKSVDVIPVGSAARQALVELRRGRAVAIVADRPVAADRGVPVTFFGRRTFVPGGSAALAVRSGAPVLPGFLWYGPGGTFRVRAFPPAFPRPVRGQAERDAEVVRLTQYLMSCQEEVVRASPTQWFMFRRFWPQPADAAVPVPAGSSAA